MLELRNIEKIYNSKNGLTVRAVDDISLQFEDKGMVFLLGKSGSGKSTMLNLIGGLDKPDSGEIIIKGRNSRDFTPSDFDSYRNTFVGFIFQDYNLLDEFTLEENISLALKLQGKEGDDDKVKEILRKVDLEDLGKRKPNTLSGGQKQRIAIARALIKEPEIIMADEPTGALDSNTGEQVFELLKELSKTKLVIVVSHDRDFAERYADRIIELSDGKVVSDISKYNSKAEVVSKNVSIIDGKTAIIKDVNSVTEYEIKKILDAVKQNGKEAVLTAGVDELKDVKHACGISSDGEKRNFTKTGGLKLKSYNSSETNFIKSKLPLENAVKMGVSGLKAKPVRLVFTIFLSVLAFCMFGVMSTLMLYNPAYTMSKALSEDNYRSVVLDRNYNYEDQQIFVNEKGEEQLEKSETGTQKALFTPNDIDVLNDNSKGLNFAGVFSFTSAEAQNNAKPFNIEVTYGANKDYSEFYSVRSLFGFSDAGEEYMQQNGIEMIAGRYPLPASQAEKGRREIAISEYIFNMIKDQPNSGYSSPQDIVDDDNPKIIKLKGSFEIRARIVGVFKASDLSEYYAVKSRFETEEENKYRAEKILELKNNISKSFETIAFVADDFYSGYQSFITTVNPPVPTTIKARGVVYQIGTEPVKENANLTTDTLNFYTTSIVNARKDAFKFYDVYGAQQEFELGDRELYISKTLFNEELSKHADRAEIADVKVYFKNYEGQVVEYSIKGYYDLPTITVKNLLLNDNFLYEFCVVNEHTVNRRITDYVRSENEKYNYVISHSDNSVSQISYVLEERGTIFHGLVNDEYETLFSSDVMGMIQQVKKIFVIAAAVVGVFSALMLLNFISVSITAKRKEIGILRAVGARGADVFKIFFAESIVLSAICFAAASILGFIVCAIINNFIYGMCGLILIKYGLVNILMILFISSLISFVATAIPVSQEAKKSPVESIRQL